MSTTKNWMCCEEPSHEGNILNSLSWQWDIYRQVEGIGILKSAYYFANYACRAVRKAMV